MIDGRGPFPPPVKVFADSVDEGKLAVQAYADKGYEQIKIYGSLRPDLVAPLAAQAHALHLRVSGHVPQGMGAEDAVRAGFDEIQHLELVLLGLFAKKGDESRTEAGRFVPVAEGMASLDLSSPPVQALASLLAERRTVVDPTLASFERVWSGRLAPGYADLGRCLPALVRRDVLFGDRAIPAGKEATYRASFAAMARLVKQLWDRGVPLVAGSDTLPGVGLQRELELYEAAGIPAADVLAMATIGAARVARQEHVLGSIAPGKQADLVLFAGHPDEHVRDLRDPVLVLRAGVAYVTADLRRAAGMSCEGSGR
jgi:imidazolonepropionase-like amidohydrolase